MFFSSVYPKLSKKDYNIFIRRKNIKKCIKMSCGRRVPLRSIKGSKVCAMDDDGFWYTGTIMKIHSREGNTINNNTPERDYRFDVSFDYRIKSSNTAEKWDPVMAAPRSLHRVFSKHELHGLHFLPITSLILKAGQRVFLTHNGREIAGDVVEHKDSAVKIQIITPGREEAFVVKKRIDEVRLMESRRSARLADSNTDFAALADMGNDRDRDQRKRGTIAMQSAEVYRQTMITVTRKISPYSSSQQHLSLEIGSQMSFDENLTQALRKEPEELYRSTSDVFSGAEALMDLACSNGNLELVRSPQSWTSSVGSCGSYSPTSSDDTEQSRRDRTESACTDEGIVFDYPMKQQAKFRCKWINCHYRCASEKVILHHVKKQHLKIPDCDIIFPPSDDDDACFHYDDVQASDNEEDEINTPKPPTLSHRDMARPPHEDPEYQRKMADLCVPERTFNHNHQHVSADARSRYLHHQTQSNQTTNAEPPPHLAHHNYTWQPTTSAAQSSSSRRTEQRPRTPQLKQRQRISPYPSPLAPSQYNQSPTQVQHQPNLNATSFHDNSSTSSYFSGVEQQHSSSNGSILGSASSHFGMHNITLSPLPSHQKAQAKVIQSRSGPVTIITSYHTQQQQQDQNSNANNQNLYSSARKCASGTGKPNARRTRGENKKCRKMYGTNRREEWCTQCRWKKACTRFNN